MIKKIIKYFSDAERIKRKELKEIDKRIVNADDYDELVKLTKLYNRIKNENKTNQCTGVLTKNKSSLFQKKQEVPRDANNKTYYYVQNQKQYGTTRST